MTLSTTLRHIAMSLRAEATQVNEGPAIALRAQARALDDAARQAEALEYDKATLMKHVPLHPICEMRVPDGMGGSVVG